MKKLKLATLLALPIALGIYLNSAMSWRPRTLAAFREPVLSVSWSPDGKQLASAGGDGNVSVWNVGAMRLERMLEEQPRKATQVAFSPDGKWLAASFSGTHGKASDEPDEEGGLGKACVWSASSGALRHSFHVWGDMTGVAWTRDAEALATSAEGEVALWNAQGKMARGKARVSQRLLHGLVLSPDGRFAIGLSEEPDAYWMDLRSASPKYLSKRFTIGNCAAFSPDGKTLAIGATGRVLLYNVQTRRVLPRLASQSTQVNAVAFSPDGSTLAAGGSAGLIELWDVASRKPLRVLKGHTKAVTSLAFAPDGNTLASSSADGTVRLWRVR